MSRVLPILFNTEMVRAVMDGRKTTTRRTVKGDVVGILNSPYHKEHPEVSDKVLLQKLCKAPYKLGDILYVRETFRPLSNHPAAGVEYAADWSPKYFENSKNPRACNNGKWKPSIHMPKEAARIWLKVTDVRVERLQEMETKDDRNYIAEGAMDKHDFIRIWNSTIKESELDRYGWNANPWVWVIEFEQCEKPNPCILKGEEPAEDKIPCIGYGISEDDDEPCEMCKGCKDYSGNEGE